MKYIFGLLFAISAYFLSLGAGKDFHFSLYGLVAAIVCYAAYALLVYFSQKDKESAQENFSRRYDELINKLESVQESITNAELKFLENLKNIGGQICELDQKQKDCYDKTISHIENEAQEATIKLQSIIDKNAQTQSEGIKVVLSKIEDTFSKEQNSLKDLQATLTSVQAKSFSEMTELLNRHKANNESLLSTNFGKIYASADSLSQFQIQKFEEVGCRMEALSDCSYKELNRLKELQDTIASVQAKSFSDLTELLDRHKANNESLLSTNFERIHASTGNISQFQARESEAVRCRMETLSSWLESFRGDLDKTQSEAFDDVKSLMSNQSTDLRSLLNVLLDTLNKGVAGLAECRESLKNESQRGTETVTSVLDQLKQNISESMNTLQDGVTALDGVISERDASYVGKLDALDSSFSNNFSVLRDSLKEIVDRNSDKLESNLKQLESTMMTRSDRHDGDITKVMTSLESGFDSQRETLSSLSHKNEELSDVQISLSRQIIDKADSLSKELSDQANCMKEIVGNTIDSRFENEKARIHEAITNIESQIAPLQTVMSNLDKCLLETKNTIREQEDDIIALVQSNREGVTNEIEQIRQIEGSVKNASEKAIREAYSQERERLSNSIDKLYEAYIEIGGHAEEFKDNVSEVVDRLKEVVSKQDGSISDRIEEIEEVMDKLNKAVRNAPYAISDAISEVQISLLKAIEKSSSVVEEQKKSKKEVEEVTERLKKVSQNLRK